MDWILKEMLDELNIEFSILQGLTDKGHLRCYRNLGKFVKHQEDIAEKYYSFCDIEDYGKWTHYLDPESVTEKIKCITCELENN